MPKILKTIKKNIIIIDSKRYLTNLTIFIYTNSIIFFFNFSICEISRFIFVKFIPD
jgi:hypothetical protein